MFRLAYEMLLLTVAAAWRSLQYWRITTQLLKQYESEVTFNRLQRVRLRTYSIALPVCEHLFGRLTGERMTREHHLRTAYLSSLVPFFDDLIDEGGYTFEEIRQICQMTPVRNDWRERISIDLFRRIGLEWSDIWEQVLIWQFNSRKQVEKIPLSDEEIKSLTANKGGYSVLLGMKVIGHFDNQPLEQAAFAFGHVAQLLNDIFDVWKDREAGQQTLLTNTRDLRPFAAYYRQVVKDSNALIAALPYSQWRIKGVLLQYSTVQALGEIALQRLEKLQAENNHVFDLNTFTRHQLVCDMAKWSNRFRWGWLVLKNTFKHG